uniref:Uncharacterized protein n=1 Tax=Timema poppense TaxID=170557 RepID=A0A7R9CN11_TIMPO|nr:unnamed protein product [Timema poppensis]
MEVNETNSRFKYTIKPRKIPPQHIITRLIRRETFGCRRPGTQFHTAREFHQNIFPNFTIVNVEKPPCFLRKFSPDGKHFIAFSADQTSLEVYSYRGCFAAADLVNGCTGEYIGNENNDKSDHIRNKVFERFFKLKYTVNVAQSGEQLNRECSLFTDDGRYVIVGSATYIPEELRPRFHEIYTNNEAVTPNPRSPLEDYSLHLVDLQNGILCNTRYFKVDKIFLSHNQGLYLYKDTLAVLSVQHQTIHIFQLVEGVFINVRTIGRFCYEDDEYELSLASTQGNMGNQLYRAFREMTINSLKHRLLVFLYRRAHHISKRKSDPYYIRMFYKYFDQFKALRMWKMQLLDESHLLIKYASEDVVTLKASEPNSLPAFFVMYNIFTTEVLEVYENSSENLLELFENFCDLFRNAKLHSESQFTCSPSNNIYARLGLLIFGCCLENRLLIQQRFKQTIVSARFGGPTEATKRLLAQLPISAQSYSSSPYLDLSLFSYDDKWVSVMERPKACGEHPIRLIQQRFKQTIVSARFGGPTEATKRLLAQLPISAQSYSSSPYLDLSLFSYDDKWVSVMERPKACGEHPIRFYSRDSGLLKFRIYAGVLGKSPPPSARRLVAFTFHPTDPFAISVQRTNAEYVVNFHIRHV